MGRGRSRTPKPPITHKNNADQYVQDDSSEQQEEGQSSKGSSPSSPPSKHNYFVKTRGSIITVGLHREATIEDLQDETAKIVNTSKDKFWLYYAGQRITQMGTLHAIGITPGSTIGFSLRAPSNHQRHPGQQQKHQEETSVVIEFRNALDMPAFAIRPSISTKIIEIKDYILNTLGLDYDDYRILHKGREPSDDQTLQDLQVTHGEKFILGTRMRGKGSPTAEPKTHSPSIDYSKWESLQDSDDEESPTTQAVITDKASAVKAREAPNARTSSTDSNNQAHPAAQQEDSDYPPPPTPTIFSASAQRETSRHAWPAAQQESQINIFTPLACRYGAKCYRPQCWYRHDDHENRCQALAIYWGQQCNQQTTPTEPTATCAQIQAEMAEQKTLLFRLRQQYESTTKQQ